MVVTLNWKTPKYKFQIKNYKAKHDISGKLLRLLIKLEIFCSEQFKSNLFDCRTSTPCSTVQVFPLNGDVDMILLEICALAGTERNNRRFHSVTSTIANENWFTVQQR